jgi:diacylglycerol kinase family enzyme
VVRSLEPHVDLEVVETRYRGHAGDLAEAAVADGRELLLTLGGDGTVNEAVNGIIRGRARLAGATAAEYGLGGVPVGGCGPEGAGSLGAATEACPLALAPLPGGSGNVFVRSLGLPADIVGATDQIVDGIKARRLRKIGLGLAIGHGQADDRDLTDGRDLASGRYFTFSAELGLGAEVVRDVENLRARGKRASPGLYLWTATRRYFTTTDRRHPALTLHSDGRPEIGNLFLGIVCNTSQWTFIGNHPVSPTPNADFNSGLDVFALNQMKTLTTLGALRQMLHARNSPPNGRHVVTLHDEDELTLRSRRPIAFQIDGEYVGEPESVTFRFVPDALRVVA